MVSDEGAGRMSRREAIGRIMSGVLTYEALQFPRDVNAGEPEVTSELYRLRDLEVLYERWKTQKTSTHIPPLEVFRAAVMTCREAACAIFLMKGPTVSASHSGFIISIPEEHQTQNSRDKIYVVTCDHARLDHRDTRPIIQLSNGTTITPEIEIVAQFGARGLPVKDLRIYECLKIPVPGVRGLPLRPIEVRPPQDAPAMTYEPLNLRARQMVDERRQTVVLQRQLQSDRVAERFILTSVSHPSEFRFDPSYPENWGFNTAGHLKVGGSGSPVILFTERDFSVAGHQVSYGERQNHDGEDRIDGEVNYDANVVHINNAINLLHERGRWK